MARGREVTTAGRLTRRAPNLPKACHSLMERSPVPIAELEGARHVLRYANLAFCRLVGKAKETLVGNPFPETLREGDACVAVLDRVYRTGEAEIHTEGEHPEPHSAYWSYTVWPVLSAAQQPIGLMMQVTESTRFHQQATAVNEALLVSSVRQHERTAAAEKANEQLQAEIEHRKLLVAELHHRVKNMLTTVQSIAMQTMQNSPTVAGFRDAFEARLEALAMTHDLLVQNPAQVTALRQLAADHLSYYAAENASRYTIEGDDVLLQSRHAVPVGMMFHELATNAVKYGALSVPSGRIKVSWTVDRDARSLYLQWAETGGPAVRTPTRRGFGSRLIERGLAHELGADVRLIFNPNGVRCSMRIPLLPAAEVP